MAAANSLVTLDEAKTHLGVALTDDTYDERILSLIDASSNQIERYCKTAFIQRTITAEPHDGQKKNIFLLKYPVVSITTFVDPGTNTVASTDYYLDKPTGRLSHWGRFPRPTTSDGLLAKWLITYVAGWYSRVDLVDADLKLACLMLVSLNFESPTGGISSIGVGSLSVSYESSSGTIGGIPDSVAGILGSYRRGLCP